MAPTAPSLSKYLVTGDVRSSTEGNIETQVLAIDASDPLAAGVTFLERIGESIDADLPADVGIDLDIHRIEDGDAEEARATAIAEIESDIEDEADDESNAADPPTPDPNDDREGDTGTTET